MTVLEQDVILQDQRNSRALQVLAGGLDWFLVSFMGKALIQCRLHSVLRKPGNSWLKG